MRLMNATTEVSDCADTMREFAERLQHYAALFNQQGNTPDEEDVAKARACVEHYSSELLDGLQEAAADGLFGITTRDEEDNFYRR